MAASAEASEHALREIYRQVYECIQARGNLMPGTGYTSTPTSPLLPPIEMPKPSSLMPIYVAIILGGTVIGGILAIAISLLRPPPIDNATLISTVLTGVGVAVLQALNFIKSSQAVAVATQTTSQVEVLHKSVNSGFEEFTRLIREEAFAAGVKESETAAVDLAAVEARITAAVAAALVKRDGEESIRTEVTHDTTKEVAKEMATKMVEEMASVDVATIQPAAVEDIVEAVRPAMQQDITDAVDAAQPPKDRSS